MKPTLALLIALALALNANALDVSQPAALVRDGATFPFTFPPPTR